MTAHIATIDQVKAALSRGKALHMCFLNGARFWWIEPDGHPIEVKNHVAMALLTSGDLEEANDSLFGLHNNSQTYRGVSE